MRYTTVIDISEMPDIYRNKNAVLLYIHMCLKCGYHDEDRDVLEISIRNLAIRSGLSVSATRHALAKLEASKLIARQDGRWYVRKWVPTAAISPRPKEKPTAVNGRDNELATKRDRQIDEYRRKLEAAIRSMTREEIGAWIQELADGRRLRHKGVTLEANENSIRYLKEYLKRI